MPPDAVRSNDFDLHAPPRSRRITPGAWRYSLRPAKHGEWLVERGEAEAGGVFVTLRAALRFLQSDLDVMVVSGHAEDRS